MKKPIFVTAGTTSLLTSSVLTGIGVGLAQTCNGIPEKWVEMIEGLTKLVAAYVLGKIAVRYAAYAFAEQQFKNKPPETQKDKALLLLPVAMNILRETGEGALFSLGLIVQRRYEAIAFNLIPFFTMGGMILAGAIKQRDWCQSDGGHCSGRMVPEVLLTSLFALMGTGLFSTAWHDIEEVAGETPVVYNFGDDVTVGDDYKILSHKNLPFALLGPFGYRPNPTYLTFIMGGTYFAGIVTTIIATVWMAKRQPLSTDS